MISAVDVGNAPACERLPGLRDALEMVRSTPGAALVVYSLSRYDRAGKRVWDLLHEGSEGLRIISATQAIDTEAGDCHGFLVGEPHCGIAYMFQMMSEARLLIGLGGRRRRLRARDARRGGRGRDHAGARGGCEQGAL